MKPSEVWGYAGESILIAGLTGGIASGKTEVAKELSSLGASVIDADQVARDVVLPGTDTFRILAGTFGDEILNGEGRIDREKLAQVVFSDEEKRAELNGITHPAIFREIQLRVNSYAAERTEDDPPVVIVDAALIVDVGASSVFDMLIVVVADEPKKIERLMEYRNMSRGEAEGRIAAQLPDSERVRKADLVIENNGDLDELRKKVQSAWAEIRAEARGRYS